MAGFMAGFGEAFSNSFNQSKERADKRRDDLFKLTYNEYLSRKKTKEEADKKNNEAVSYGKAMLAGREDIPQEAAFTIAQWKLAGLTDAQIQDNIDNGEWTKNNDLKPSIQTTSQPTQPTAEDRALQGKSIEAGNPVTLTKGTEGKGGIFGDLFSREGRNNRDKNRAMNEAAKTAGMDRTEFDKFMSESGETSSLPQTSAGISFSRKPEPIEHVGHAEALWRREMALENNNPKLAGQYDSMIKQHEFAKQFDQAAKDGGGRVAYKLRDGTWKIGLLTQEGDKTLDPQGNEVDVIATRPIKPDEAEIHKELRARNPEIEKYRARQVDTANLMSAAKELDDIASLRPNVLTRTGRLTGMVREIYNDIAAAGDLMTRMSGKTSKEVTKQLQDAGIIREGDDASSLEDRVSDMLRKGEFASDAEAQALFDTKVKLMTYRIGRLEGESGRGMSNQDYARLEGVIKDANGDLKTFKSGLNSYVRGLIESMEAEAVGLNDYNVSVKQLKEQFGVSPVDEVTPGLRSFIEATDNEKYAEAYDYFTSNESLTAAEHVRKGVEERNNTKSSKNKEQVQEAAPPGFKPVGRTPDGRTVYEDENGRRIARKAQ